MPLPVLLFQRIEKDMSSPKTERQQFNQFSVCRLVHGLVFYRLCTNECPCFYTVGGDVTGSKIAPSALCTLPICVIGQVGNGQMFR